MKKKYKISPEEFSSKPHYEQMDCGVDNTA